MSFGLSLARHHTAAHIKVAPVVLSVALLACRGHGSQRPPVRIIRDMTQQAHILPQSALGQGRSNVNLLELRVAVEEPVELGPFETGKTSQKYVSRTPVMVDEQTVSRGEERFNIYCSPCHDRAGTGHGIVPQRGSPGPIELASDNTRKLTDGEIFSVITDGARNMPAMREQVAVADRWSIVLWVRVLQRSQSATLVDVEPPLRSSILAEDSSE